MSIRLLSRAKMKYEILNLSGIYSLQSYHTHKSPYTYGKKNAFYDWYIKTVDNFGHETCVH